MSTNRSKSKTLTAAGFSDPIPIDLRRFHMGVGLIATLSGTGLYTVQVSGDDPRAGFTHWNDHDLMNGLSASQNGNLAFPVTAVRLNATSLTGTLTLSVIQPIGTA